MFATAGSTVPPPPRRRPQKTDHEQAGKTVEHARRVARVGIRDDLHVGDATAERPTQAAEQGESRRSLRCQSSRPESSTAARAPSAPGIIAPYSWPKFPRIPHPSQSEARQDVVRADAGWRASSTSRSSPFLVRCESRVDTPPASETARARGWPSRGRRGRGDWLGLDYVSFKRNRACCDSESSGSKSMASLYQARASPLRSRAAQAAPTAA